YAMTAAARSSATTSLRNECSMGVRIDPSPDDPVQVEVPVATPCPGTAIGLVFLPMAGRNDYGMPTTNVGNAANGRARMLSPVGEFFAPVLSSAERPGWNRVLVELHQTGEWEGEKRLPFHLVSLVLRPSPRVATRLEGGRMHTEPTAPGHMFVIPAGCNHWASWKRGTDFISAYLAPEALASAVSDEGLDAPGLEIAHRAHVYDPELAAILLTMQGQLNGPNAEDRLFVDTLGVQLAVQLALRHGTAPVRLRSYRNGLSRA